jgi:hypothetical protein
MTDQFNKTAYGMGMWSAFRPKESKAKEGLVKLASSLRELGITWWAPRVGDYGKLADFTPSELATLFGVMRDAGLGVLPWWYSRPQFIDREVKLASTLMGLGASGVIIDAEIEWTGCHVQAVELGRKMRAELGDAYIAHAPLAWLPYHPRWPYEEFGAFVDQVMPQTYWTELKRGLYEGEFESVLQTWERMAEAGDVRAKNYAPIGVTYGRSDMLARGMTAKAAPPGEFKVGNLQSFIARYGSDYPASQGGTKRTMSFYSYEAANPHAFPAIQAYTNSLREADTKPAPKAKG